MIPVALLNAISRRRDKRSTDRYGSYLFPGEFPGIDLMVQPLNDLLRREVNEFDYRGILENLVRDGLQ